MSFLSRLSPLRRKQLAGFAGAMPAVAASVFCWQNPEFLCGNAILPVDNVAQRLAYAVGLMLATAIMLLLGILGASRRGFYGDAIEGTRSPQSNSLEINLRYNQNTVEQTLFAVIIWACLAIELPIEKLIIIPNLATFFVIGRVTFWVGYLINPMARTFGMTLTVFPNLIGLFWLIAGKMPIHLG